MEDLSEALNSESDDDGDMQALNLVQTGASVERTTIVPSDATVLGAVRADGSIEINPHKAAISSEGVMHFSVDVHGGLHAEEGISLVQTKARAVPKRASSAPALTSQKEKVTVEKDAAKEVIASAEKDASAVKEAEKTATENKDVSEEAADEAKDDSDEKVAAEEKAADEVDAKDKDASEEKPADEKAAVEKEAAAKEEITVETDKTLKIRKTAVPDDEKAKESLSLTETDSASLVIPDFDYKAKEGLSLMQTGAKMETKSILSRNEAVMGSVQADGSIEINPQKMVVPNDGIMHFSVDEHGGFHSEDSISLIQTEARVHSSQPPSDPVQNVEPSHHPSWTLEALSNVDALSLIQTGAHIERKSIHKAGSVQSDGTFEMNPHKTKVPKEGMMHLSVDTHGAFHIEM